ncbi:AraC family transcriptional regulator [Arthrobacter sp. ERGS1:01]|uniref:helix-turn-helix transcriptional regulator n=1 Tax=Arthrobacter sp. ERGS1:01 TaxID=1704044 RepID=UPI0006B5DBAB|nr:helix-turn-helix transcriptional regulator [Arthrobacter sp. ERGS1:01]ALE06582.1 AraC family transcriptional regulator [Arthrobacter sp. ERGS1:01]
MASQFKGILYPARLPDFHRLPAGPEVAELVQWFWIPEWDIDPGRTSRQQLIAFPASNLVVEPGGVEFSGPTTRVAHRDLSGRSWAVGALLRPAAIPAFTADPGSLRDTSLHPDAPELQASVTAAMAGADPGERRQRAADALAVWLAAAVGPVSAEARAANRMVEVIGGSAEVLRIEDVADVLATSPRTLQRLARKYVGLSPSALIRRRRLQEAADRSRTEPLAELADIAADLGYADHAHLCKDFQRYLGFTPSSYRRSVGGDR